jgi:multicomponent Na+:H+ antiporter subunit E
VSGGRRSLAARVVSQGPPAGWLVLVWVLLWGDWSWANVLGGLVVAVAVVNLLPLPDVVQNARLHPLAFGRLVVFFLRDLTVANWQVAWLAVRPGGPPRGALVRVGLRTDSDLLLTLVAEALTLVPGSVVLDVDRPHRELSLHLLHVRDGEDLCRQKASVLATEDRVVRAFGSAEDIAALDRERL